MPQTNIAFDLPLEEDNFQSYMSELETTVLAVAVDGGLIGKRETLPLRPGKLSRSQFGRKVGLTFESAVSFAVDYYGMLKKSSALISEVEWVRKQLDGKQVKTIEGIIIHFASLRIEHIARLNPSLTSMFPVFKKNLLESRGFKIKF
jgi:hypothetical protein